MSETLDEIWTDDLLDRRSDARLLHDFLIRRHEERNEAGERGAYVVNLNAAWGHGKTFFLDRLARQLRADGHLVAGVNAWRDDSSHEPMIAVMAAIEASLKPHFAESDAMARTWAAAKANGGAILASLAKGTARQVVRKVVGEGVEEATELLRAQNEWVSDDVERALVHNAEKAGDAVTTKVTTLLTRFVDQKLTDYQARIQSTLTFQARMRDMLGEISRKGVKSPFFVLVDELDRCRPTYAIEMLEQVKHLFDIDDVIFLIATDGDQLAHAVRAVYGEGFDGKRYLLRFFHRHYRFEERDRTAFAAYLFDRHKIDKTKLGTPFQIDPVRIFVGAMAAYDVTPRDAEQCFDILRSVLTLWDQPIPLQLSIALPLIILHQRHESDRMEAFIHDQGQSFPVSRPWLETAMMEDDWRRSSKNTVAVNDLNRELLGRASQSLLNIEEVGRATPAQQFVSDVLVTEHHRINSDGYVEGGPMSIILQYPTLIRQVGRLSVSA